METLWIVVLGVDVQGWRTQSLFWSRTLMMPQKMGLAAPESERNEPETGTTLICSGQHNSLTLKPCCLLQMNSMLTSSRSICRSLCQSTITETPRARPEWSKDAVLYVHVRFFILCVFVLSHIGVFVGDTPPPHTHMHTINSRSLDQRGRTYVMKRKDWHTRQLRKKMYQDCCRCVKWQTKLELHFAPIFWSSLLLWKTTGGTDKVCTGSSCRGIPGQNWWISTFFWGIQSAPQVFTLEKQPSVLLCAWFWHCPDKNRFFTVAVLYEAVLLLQLQQVHQEKCGPPQNETLLGDWMFNTLEPKCGSKRQIHFLRWRWEKHHGVFSLSFCLSFSHWSQSTGPPLFRFEGTPSLAEPETISAIIERVKSLVSLSQNAEVTMEVNPTELEMAKLKYVFCWPRLSRSVLVSIFPFLHFTPPMRAYHVILTWLHFLEKGLPCGWCEQSFAWCSGLERCWPEDARTGTFCERHVEVNCSRVPKKR